MKNALHNTAEKELADWQHAMQRKSAFSQKAIKSLQNRINNLIPEVIHRAITKVIQELVKAVIQGAHYTNPLPTKALSLEEREKQILEIVNFYCSSAAAEGAITGLGGFVSGLADFPLWISLKMKMLFEMAAKYGHDTRDYRERLFILYVFQLAFSSQDRRNQIYELVSNWGDTKKGLPTSINDFDWRTFQLDYRDNIDLAKLLQLIPGLGAVVGAVVNHRLTNRLSKVAMNAYRMRWLMDH